MAIIIPMPYETDLARPLCKTLLPEYLQAGDELCHRFQITVTLSGTAQSLSGALITCYVIRADGTTAVCEGSASGNVAAVTLPDACYRVPGRFNLIIRATRGDTKTTLFWAEGAVVRTTTEDLVDPEDIIPTLDDLLQQIDRMEAATADAEAATQAAKAATAETIAVRQQAADALADANTAIAKTNAWVNATATATGLAAGAAPTVSVSDGSSGKVLHFGIPKGDTGAAGPVGPAGPQGAPGATGATPAFRIGTVVSGSSAGASISGTAANPVLNLTLPKGDKGDPGSSGNVVCDLNVVYNATEDLGSAIVVQTTGVWNHNVARSFTVAETKAYLVTVGLSIYGKQGDWSTLSFLLDGVEYDKSYRLTFPLPDDGALATACMTVPVNLTAGNHTITIRNHPAALSEYLASVLTIAEVKTR